MTALVTLGWALCLLASVGLIAYQRGRRQGRVVLPPDLVAELQQHKTRCLGEAADRVALEIGLLCETDARAS